MIQSSASEVRDQRPLRVLLVADKLGFKDVKLHGTGRLIVEWATAFDPSRVVVTTCVLRDAGDFGEELRRSGVPIHFFGDARFSPVTLWKLIRIIRAERIDVLHLNGHGASALGRLAGRLTGVPAIVHVHGDAAFAPGGYPRYVRLVDNLLAPWTARAVSISEATREFCIRSMGFRPAQVEILLNPTPRLGHAGAVDERVRALRLRYGIRDDEPVVGIASRLYPVKGHHILLPAFQQVLRRVPAAKLLIVGDGPERANLEAQARSLGLSQQVSFAGFQEDIAAHLRLCWVTAVPSVHPEPFGLVVVESMAAGVPVIASRIGGLPEIVTDGVAGLLVEAEQPEALATAMVRVLEDSDLRHRLASRCIAESERFSMDHFVQRMEAIYREVVAVSGATLGRHATPRVSGWAGTPDTITGADNK